MSSAVAGGTDVCSPVSLMLSLARPSPGQAVAVLGPHALDMTLELCRLGHDEVVCGGRPGAPACTERSHLVLVGGPMGGQPLLLLLRDAASRVGEEGVMVLHLADVDQDRVVEAALAARGLAIGSTVFNLSGPTLVRHTVRRLHETELRAAA